MVGANPYREPTPRGQDGHHPRSHQRRSRDPRHRRRVVRGARPTTSASSSASGSPERLRWLGEALPIMRGMLDGTEPTAAGPALPRRARRATCRRPIQPHLPICVGGGGEKVTLKLVAKYADMNNIGGGVETVRRKEAILLEHCATVGRDPSEIERTTGIGIVVHPRRPAPRRSGVFREAFERNRIARTLGGPAGRDAGGRRRDAGAVRRARLPPPGRRCSRPTTTRSR